MPSLLRDIEEVSDLPQERRIYRNYSSPLGQGGLKKGENHHHPSLHQYHLHLHFHKLKPYPSLRQFPFSNPSLSLINHNHHHSYQWLSSLIIHLPCFLMPTMLYPRTLNSYVQNFMLMTQTGPQKSILGSFKPVSKIEELLMRMWPVGYFLIHWERRDFTGTITSHHVQFLTRMILKLLFYRSSEYPLAPMNCICNSLESRGRLMNPYQASIIGSTVCILDFKTLMSWTMLRP